ncbi:protein kinase [bacterium]|nr:protein kinase [bacterium]
MNQGASNQVGPFSSGDVLEGFRLEECIGSGGMGMAWKATQLALDRVVCVKFMHPDHRVHPGYMRLLQSEAKTLATLDHPNILTIHHFGEADGHFFIVTEFVGGPSIQELIAKWILTPDEKLEVIRATGAAMQFVHERGVLHRDLKPANILVSQWGRVKVADFGLSKMLQSPGDMTSTGHLGTESYAAPEILLGRNYDHRADQFSLAVTFYRLLTGFFPPIPGTENPNRPLPPSLEQIFERALSIEAVNRYPSVQDFCVELLAALEPGWEKGVSLEQLYFPIRRGLSADTPGIPRNFAPDPRDAPTADPLPPARDLSTPMIRLDESWMPIPKALDTQRPSGMVPIPVLSPPTPTPTATRPQTPVPVPPTPLPVPAGGFSMTTVYAFLIGVLLTVVIVLLVR